MVENSTSVEEVNIADLNGLLNSTSLVVSQALSGEASLTVLSESLEAASKSIEAALSSGSTTSSQMSSLQMAAAVIEMALAGDMFIENLSSTLEIVSTALQLAVNETTIPEPTALEVAAESILQELTDDSATSADIALALEEALQAIKDSVAEELSKTKLTVDINLGAAANEMEATTEAGEMDSTVASDADMESTTMAGETDMTSTMSDTEDSSTDSEMVSTSTALSLEISSAHLIFYNYLYTLLLFKCLLLFPSII